jgi:hypothetical protein
MKKTFLAKIVLSFLFIVISLKFFVGVISGYLASNFYFNKVYGKKKFGKFTLGSIYIPFGRYKIHLHHWLYPSLILGWGAIVDAFFMAFYFPVGILVGIALHDFATDKNWYKVIIPR